MLSRKFRLPFEIPIEEYPPPATFIEEAISCVEGAAKERIMLRVMGALGIYIHAHSLEYRQLWERLGRLGERVFSDIDFASYGKFRQKVFEFFKRRGYDIDKKIQMFYGMKRHIYYGGKVPMVEVFFDKLEMNHTIIFNRRLEVDHPTIPIAELLLQKLQIVKINEKDIKDVIVLLRAHDVGKSDKEMINLNALADAGLLSDWGFYYTVTMNLKKVMDFSLTCDVLTQDDRVIINERVNKILSYLEEQPKSLSWKLRAKVGTSKKWYNEVEDWIFFRAEA